MILKENDRSFITFKKLGLFGKLGNQLFQIATIAAYANTYNIECIIPKWKNTWTEDEDMTNIFTGSFITDPNIIHVNTENFKESSMKYSKIPEYKKINIEGYFQSEKYFEKKSDYIRSIFSINEEIKEKIIKKNIGTFENACSIHIRRNDYLKYPNVHPCLNMAYYQEAVLYMKSLGYYKFLIFSDDMEWCKTQFTGKEYIFSDKNTKNYEDLILMSLCKSHIIANSTFSWWGAWLCENVEKNVIAPKTWFGPNGPQQHDIIPKEWIQI